MTKYVFPVLGAVLLLGGALLLPRLTSAGASAGTGEPAITAKAQIEPQPSGYRSCFQERSFVASGTPRFETRRRCVFDE